MGLRVLTPAGRLVASTVAATGVALVAPGVAAADTTLHGFPNATVAGALIGLVTFFVLARRPIPASAIAAAPRRRLVTRSIVLTLVSVREEAIWRGLVLGLLAGPAGRLGALAASTALFATAHVRGQGRAAAAHLVTGLSFGLAYVATGRLVAAMVAHASYNVLVGASSLATQEVSLSDTGRASAAVVASRPLSRRPRSMHERITSPNAVVASLEGVVKSFSSVRALDGIDLELRRGEILAVLGPNGAGKTTAVAIMLGLRRADEGRATLFGHDPRLPRARRHVGAVLQEITFPPAVRVRETVELARAHFPNPPSTVATLARLGLESEANRDAAGLSGGQRRRLAVALALAGDPDALFLDEPTAGMDASARRSLLGDIVDFAGKGGAVLLTTQQLAEAEEIASRVVLVSRGRVLLEGTVNELRARGGLVRVTLHASSLPPLPGVASADSRGTRHVVYVDDADLYVANLVRSGVAFHGLEVVPASLEDAFVTLTGEAIE